MIGEIDEPLRRLALVKVSIGILMDILTTGWNGNGVYCTRGIPSGSKFIRADYVPDEGLYYLLIEHESFDPVYPGYVPFEITCQFVREVTEDGDDIGQ